MLPKLPTDKIFFKRKKKIDGLWVLSHFSHVQLCAILWTIACQAPLSMGFSCISFSNPNPGIEPGSLALQADALSSEPPGKPLLAFHAKMGSIKGRNGMDLTEAEDIKKRWEEYTDAKKIYAKKIFMTEVITVVISPRPQSLT